MPEALATAPAKNEEPTELAQSILVVDDDPQQRAMLERMLGGRYHCVAAADAETARAALAGQPFDLVVCDLELPGESGLDLLRTLPALQPDAAVIMVTGTDDVRTAETALGFGAYGYIVKPYRHVELLVNVSNALRRRALEIEHRAYTGRLENRLLERTSALNSALSELESARLETLHHLSLAVEARDRVTADHVDGMIKIVERFARVLGYGEMQSQSLGAASSMHDLGKIGVPDEVLLKPGALTEAERDLMERHAEIGHRMLSGSRNPLLQLGAEIAWAHHERWDGQGYPRGLAEDKIPESARIVQIVDVFSAMTTDRPYRRALPLEVALRELSDGAGTQFDPRFVAAFLEHFDRIVLG